MINVDSPDRAAMRARAAVTVVLPTPPFPATMARRAAVANPRGSKVPLRGVVIRRLVAALLVLGGMASLAGRAGAAAPFATTSPRARLDVLQVSGLIDPVEVDF